MSDVDTATRQRFLKRVENHWARVLEEAVWVAKRCGGKNITSDEQLGRARELVGEAVARVVTGRRAWKEDVDFVEFMKWTMRSIASGEWKKLRRQDPIAAEKENPDGNRGPKRQFAAETEAWEEALDQDDAERMVAEIIDAADGDAVCEQVVNAYLEEDCDRPRHVAARLVVSEKVVYNAQRKIERRVLTTRKKVNK